MVRLALAFIALLLLPAPAHGAEAFLGVLEDGRMVRFTSQEPSALSTPRKPVGMAPGERLVAVSDGPRGPVGVGSSARLYALDPDSGRAEAIGAPFEQGLRGSRFTLAAAPGATSARLLSDVGQDLVVDLETGATQTGPGLRRAGDGAVVRPAADVAVDGQLVGVQLRPGTFLRETAVGSSEMAASPLALGIPEAPFTEPIGFQIGTDGKGYVLGVAGGNVRSRQSILLLVDPAAGTAVGGERPRMFFFRRRVNLFASLGRVADDHTAPRATVRVPRTISVRALIARGLPVSAKVNEACQVTATLWLGGRPAVFLFAGRDMPGVVDLRQSFFRSRASERATLRRGVGRRVRVVIGVNDLKGNTRRFTRTARLAR
ncbi:MAG TPA: DUF4394 domain-containing protein [Solirubrobacteraceae bacterium]|nr:DUF4394 domain-containing protein [Solirubrobacteraceae bacterium]